MYHSPLLDSREVKKNYHPLLSHFLKQAFKNQAIKQPWFLFLNLSLSTDFLHMLMSIFWTFSLWLEISLWFKIDVILVKPIKKKSEKWYTKINRKFEQRVIKVMKKKNPIMYKEIVEKHEC